MNFMTWDLLMVHNVTACRLNDAVFNADHSSEMHLPGVVYDPVGKCAYVQLDDGTARTATRGDWIVRFTVSGRVFTRVLRQGEFESCGFAAIMERLESGSNGPNAIPSSGDGLTTPVVVQVTPPRTWKGWQTAADGQGKE